MYDRLNRPTLRDVDSEGNKITCDIRKEHTQAHQVLAGCGLIAARLLESQRCRLIALNGFPIQPALQQAASIIRQRTPHHTLLAKKLVVLKKCFMLCG